MFRRLSNIEIIEAEAIYLCIDWNVITEEQKETAMKNMQKKKTGSSMYTWNGSFTAGLPSENITNIYQQDCN